MNEANIQDIPKLHQQIQKKSEEIGFTMPSDLYIADIAQQYFGQDKRINIICEDGAKWIEKYEGHQFDLIFADAWPGKYSYIDEILKMIKIGGFYIIDDMAAQPNWPKGHEDNVAKLVTYLENREDFSLTKMNWSTGLIIAVRTK